MIMFYFFYLISFSNFLKNFIVDEQILIVMAVAQSVRAFTSYADGWVFESQPQHTYVAITGSDNSTA